MPGLAQGGVAANIAVAKDFPRRGCKDSYKPAAARISYSHAEEKKKHVQGPGGVFFSYRRG